MFRRRLFSSVSEAIKKSHVHSSKPLFNDNFSLCSIDPEVYSLINLEKNRQRSCIELTASENFTSKAVLECLGSCLTNKYSDGYPGKRDYNGCDVIDQIENLCKKRALAAFSLDSNDWGVNVQPYAGSLANFAAYSSILNPGDKIMGLHSHDGGHSTHGEDASICPMAHYRYESYHADKETGLLDFDDIRQRVNAFKPKLLVCGFSSYPRKFEFSQFKFIADDVGAYLHADISHISGLIATNLHPSPFPFADIVTSTTHKSLRGPRSGIIFYNKHTLPDSGEKVDRCVFPGYQGGPHNHHIAGLAVQLKEVATPEFKKYCQHVIENNLALAKYLQSKDYKLSTGGTDNHLMLLDLRNIISGYKFEKICERVNIILGANTLPGENYDMDVGAVRIGSCAMTTRGLGVKDFETIGSYLDRAVRLAIEIDKSTQDFDGGFFEHQGVSDLKSEVSAWAETFAYPS